MSRGNKTKAIVEEAPAVAQPIHSSTAKLELQKRLYALAGDGDHIEEFEQTRAALEAIE